MYSHVFEKNFDVYLDFESDSYKNFNICEKF